MSTSLSPSNFSVKRFVSIYIAKGVTMLNLQSIKSIVLDILWWVSQSVSGISLIRFSHKINKTANSVPFSGLITRTPTIKLLSQIIHSPEIKIERKDWIFPIPVLPFLIFSSLLSVETNATRSSFYFYFSLQYSLSSLQLHKVLISIKSWSG